MGEGRGEGLNEASATTDSASSDKTSEQHLSQNQGVNSLIQLLSAVGSMKNLRKGITNKNLSKILSTVLNQKGGSNEV